MCAPTAGAGVLEQGVLEEGAGVLHLCDLFKTNLLGDFRVFSPSCTQKSIRNLLKVLKSRICGIVMRIAEFAVRRHFASAGICEECAIQFKIIAMLLFVDKIVQLHIATSLRL